MNKEQFLNESFELVTIFNKPVLFTNLRIPRELIPDGMYCYDIRHDDECRGDMVELKDFVMVNHWGTVISDKPFEPREYDGRWFSTKEGLYIEEEDYNYLGENCSLKDYIENYDKLDEEINCNQIQDEMNFGM